MEINKNDWYNIFSGGGVGGKMKKRGGGKRDET